MDQSDKGVLLDRMRKALKQARVKRKTDLLAARLDVEHERSLMWAIKKRGPDRLNKAIEAAQARKMLATTKLQTQSGGEITVELGAVKKREPYEKRPSVRAAKKSRKNGIGPSF